MDTASASLEDTRTIHRLEPLQDRPAEDFVVCLECGQAYDRTRLPHALYHAEPDHDPFFVEQ